MPTYDYVCEACEHRLEVFQSITAVTLRKCPKCGKQKLKRLIGTGGGLIFKGSGFYITDYRSGDYKQKAEAESKAASPTASPDSKGESKSEPAKAEPKAEPKPETKSAPKSDPKVAAKPSIKASGAKKRR